MKRLLPIALVRLLPACNPPAEQVRPEDLASRRPDATVLVAVYSRSGHTAEAGRAFSEELGADFQRIQGQGGEGDDFFRTPSPGDRVTITPDHMNLGPYRLILIGSPIWYWRPTALANTFIESNDFTGKEVVLFYTNEGGIWQSALRSWRERVETRGGHVVDIVAIDRKTLAPDETIAARARSIAQSHRAKWLSPAGDPSHPAK